MGLSLANSKANARSLGLYSAILLGLFLGLWILDESFVHWPPLIIAQAFALIGLVGVGSQFAFHGLTVVSMSLAGWRRRFFQIGVSVAVPAVLSLYFIRNMLSPSTQGLFGHMLNPSYLVVVGIIAYVSWFAADQLDAEHPFRGFLIAAALWFFIFFLYQNGFHAGSEYDDYTDSSSTFIDAKRAAETGRYLGQFLVYVSASYASMLVRLVMKRSSLKASPRSR